MAKQVKSKHRSWEKYPELPGAIPQIREQLQKRKRHKNVRYLLFRFKNEVEKGNTNPSKLDDFDVPPGFIEHFLTAPIHIVQLPTGQMARIVEGRIRTPSEIGGLGSFAIRWDVDENLNVYSRHRSVWAEWRATLERVVPILGEE